MNAVTIKTYSDFNQRRYSSPWVCTMTPDGKHDFSVRCGTYTGDGRKGEGGDLVVFDPVEGQVYAYGQKDYRGNNTERFFVRWNGTEFVPCDKIGQVKEG